MNFIQKNKTIFLQILILFIPNFIVWLLLYPGYFQADHQSLIANIINGTPNQDNSLVWGYLSLPFFYWTSSYACYGLFQISIYTFCVVFGTYRLNKCGFIKKPLLFTLFMALFPTYLLYNELYSSEMVLAYFVFMTTCMLIEYVYTKDKSSLKNFFWIILFFSILICCLMRKTAILIPIILLILILIIRDENIKKFVLIAICSVLVTLLVDLGFSYLCNTDSIVSSSLQGGPVTVVPSYQIAGVYANNGEISDDSKNIFESIKTPEEWKKSYSIACSDIAQENIKLSSEFIRAYIDTAIKNPIQFIRSYFRLEGPLFIFSYNLGFDFIHKDGGTSIDLTQHDNFTLIFATLDSSNISANYKDQFGHEHSNLWNYPYKKIVDIHNSPIALFPAITDILLLNRALSFWILFVGFFISLALRKSKQFIFVSIPVLSIFIVFALFCPIVLFRYIAEMYYSLPLLLIFIYKNIYISKSVVKKYSHRISVCK